MHRDTAAHILEPIWQGILAAKLRLLEAREAAEQLQGMAAWQEIGDLQAAADWIQEQERRLGEGCLHSVLQEPGGNIVTWPVATMGAEQAARQAYLERRGERARLLIEAEEGKALRLFKELSTRPAVPLQPAGTEGGSR